MGEKLVTERRRPFISIRHLKRSSRLGFVDSHLLLKEKKKEAVKKGKGDRKKKKENEKKGKNKTRRKDEFGRKGVKKKEKKERDTQMRGKKTEILVSERSFQRESTRKKKAKAKEKMNL